MDLKDPRAAEILIQAHGKTYLTIQSVAMRLATLAFEDSVPGVGVSDGRETERQALLQALEAEAEKQGAVNPRGAVAIMFQIVAEVEDIGPKDEWNLDDTCETQGMKTPRLSAKCELGIGVRASNERNGADRV